MARQNQAFLMGAVLKDPKIVKNPDGEYLYAMVYVTVVRGYREVGDGKKFMKADNPVIITREKELIQEIERWQVYDIVDVKGPIASKNILKSSICAHCGEKNKATGSLVYINPIYARRRLHLDNRDECVNYLSTNREISNQVFVFGTLCRDPKKLTPKEGLIVTQYQVAMNRKFRIKQDPPELKTDYPWVKSYGANAMEDHKRLHTGSIVYIDGCLQARSVLRHTQCEHCNEQYDWKDRAMEIVPYATEYILNYYDDETIEENEARRLEQIKRDIFLRDTQKSDDDTLTDDNWM